MKKRIIYIMLFTLGMSTLIGCNSIAKLENQQNSTASVSLTPTPEPKEVTKQVEVQTNSDAEALIITEEDALLIVSQYVLKTVENVENIELGYSYENIQTISEVNDSCHIFRVGSETQETSTTIGYYAVSLDGSKLYVMDFMSGLYMTSEEYELYVKNNAQSDDALTTEHVLSGLGFGLLDEVMEQDGFKIRFPQFINEDNPTTADLINDIIQEDIKSFLASNELLIEGDSEISLDLTYELNGIKNKVLSIIYKGLLIRKDAAYPMNAYHTVNILVQDEVEMISLAQAFNVDNFLLDMIKDGMYSPYTQDLNLEEAIENLRELIESNWIDSDLFNHLIANPDYYFTDYGVVISVPIPHAVGDHLEMAIPYEGIENNMNKDSALWQDYMFINQN